jgi:hypothetical protein
MYLEGTRLESFLELKILKCFMTAITSSLTSHRVISNSLSISMGCYPAQTPFIIARVITCSRKLLHTYFKENFIPALNQALRHEDVWKIGDIAPGTQSRQQMVVSDKFHALLAKTVIEDYS